MGSRLSIDMQAKLDLSSALDIEYLKARNKCDNTNISFHPIDVRYTLFLNTYQQYGAHAVDELNTLCTALCEFGKTRKHYTQSGFEHMFRMTKALISLGMHINGEYEYQYLFEVFEQMHKNNDILHSPNELNVLDDFIALVTDIYVNKDNTANNTLPLSNGYLMFSPAGLNSNNDVIISKTTVDMNNQQAAGISTITPCEDNPTDRYYYSDDEDYYQIDINPTGTLTYEDLKHLRDEINKCDTEFIKYDGTLYEWL